MYISRDPALALALSCDRPSDDKLRLLQVSARIGNGNVFRNNEPRVKG